MISRFPRAERLSQGLPQPQALLPPAAPGMRRASRFLIYFKPKHTQQPVLVRLVKATFESCSSTSPRRSPAAVNLRHGAPGTQINVPWCFSPLLPALPCLRVTAGTVTAAALEPGADEPPCRSNSPDVVGGIGAGPSPGDGAALHRCSAGNGSPSRRRATGGSILVCYHLPRYLCSSTIASHFWETGSYLRASQEPKSR